MGFGLQLVITISLLTLRVGRRKHFFKLRNRSRHLRLSIIGNLNPICVIERRHSVFRTISVAVVFILPIFFLHTYRKRDTYIGIDNKSNKHVIFRNCIKIRSKTINLNSNRRHIRYAIEFIRLVVFFVYTRYWRISILGVCRFLTLHWNSSIMIINWVLWSK